MDILVKNLDGKEIIRKVDPNDTIEKLKRDIEDEYKIPSNLQRFNRRGKRVSFDFNCSDTIQMLLDNIENKMEIKRGILNVYPVRQTSVRPAFEPVKKMLVLVPIEVAKSGVGSSVEGKINKEIGGIGPTPEERIKEETKTVVKGGESVNRHHKIAEVGHNLF